MSRPLAFQSGHYFASSAAQAKPGRHLSDAAARGRNRTGAKCASAMVIPPCIPRNMKCRKCACERLFPRHIICVGYPELPSLRGPGRELAATIRVAIASNRKKAAIRREHP